MSTSGGRPPAGAARRSRDVLSLATFVGLGLPDGMLGTAWPAMRHSLRAPVGDLGFILLVGTAGSVAITTVVGRLIGRGGVARLLAGGLACAAGAAAGFAVAPAFGVLCAIGVLFGVAAGTIDGGLNTAIGLSGRGRLLNLLHGFYGVGTAIGPLVVTLALLTGSWRAAYVALVVVDALLAGAWLLERRRERVDDVAAGAAPRREVRRPPMRAAAAPIAAGIGVFFLYTGLEVGAGQWETTFTRTHLHLSASAAGLAAFGYWAALTAVRIGLALLPRPLSNARVVRGGGLIGLAATAVIWAQPGTGATVAAFIVLGGALAGVFPALVALTPLRLGTEHAEHVIAWQVGAAAAGGAGISAAIGGLIGAFGLAILGPALTVLAVLLVAGELVLARLAPARH